MGSSQENANQVGRALIIGGIAVIASTLVRTPLEMTAIHVGVAAIIVGIVALFANNIAAESMGAVRYFLDMLRVSDHWLKVFETDDKVRREKDRVRGAVRFRNMAERRVILRKCVLVVRNVSGYELARVYVGDLDLVPGQISEILPLDHVLDVKFHDHDPILVSITATGRDGRRFSFLPWMKQIQDNVVDTNILDLRDWP